MYGGVCAPEISHNIANFHSQLGVRLLAFHNTLLLSRALLAMYQPKHTASIINMDLNHMCLFPHPCNIS
jgi:hypothetical protein